MTCSQPSSLNTYPFLFGILDVGTDVAVFRTSVIMCTAAGSVIMCIAVGSVFMFTAAGSAVLCIEASILCAQCQLTLSCAHHQHCVHNTG